MEKQASVVEELFDRVTQLWTTLEEDEKVQQWDQEEETIMQPYKSSNKGRKR
jgi:hypothetical protein